MENEAIILFDGVCNFCNSTINFVIERDSNRRFKFASLQSDFARNLLISRNQNPDILESIVLVYDQNILKNSDAVLEIARHLAGWKWLYSFRFVPQFLRDLVYKLIAKNRYKLFGKSETCRIPTAEERALFLG